MDAENHQVPLMGDKEVLDAFFTLLDSTGFYWNFYVVGVAALIGWFLSASKAPPWQLRAIVSTGFVFFVLMNLSALLGRYAFLELLTTELQERLVPCIFKMQGVCDRVAKISFSWSKWYALGIHFVVDSTLLYLIWTDKVWGAIQRSDKTGN